MNIQGGGISFEVSGTNAKLMKVLEQSKRAISTFSKEGVRAGADIDKGFEQAANAIQTAFQKVDAVIDENLQAIRQLQAENEKLKKQYAQQVLRGDDEAARATRAQVQENKNLINARKKIIDQAQPIIAELNEEERKLQEQKKAIEGNVQATKSLKAQLRECKEQLAIMEANGQRGTEAYRKMQAEAGRLTDALGDAAQQAKILSHDNQLLQGTMSTVSGIAGAFTAAQGAVALFAGENENLQRIMLKVQSLMSITMGLQQVMNTLNKDSAFQLVIVARAKDMLTAANARLATALGISTAAAQALMATLTLGLSAAITAIVVLISRLSSENAKAAEQQKKFNEEVAKAAAKPLSAYIQLKTEWENLTGSMKDREKWVKENEDRFNALGLKVYDAKTAEDVLNKNTKAFVSACIAKAKALAAQQLAAEKYEEILKKQAEVEAMPDKTQKYIPSANGRGYYIEQTNGDKVDAEKELEKMRTEAKKFIEMQIQFSKQEQHFLSKLGAAAQTTVAGSVEAVEKEIASLQAQYKRAATDSRRAELSKQIKAEQEKLKKIQLDTGNGNGSGGSGNTPKDPYLDMLQKRKAAYAQYSKWVQSEDAEVRAAASTTFAELLKEGTSYLDYLEKQRETISSKATKTAADLQRLQKLNNEIAEQTKQTVLSDFEEQLNRELEQCNTIGQRLGALAKRRGELAKDNSDTDRGKAGILDAAEARVLEQAKQETAQLLQQYAAYTNERIKFEESYARNRELLNATIHAKELDTEDEFIAKMLEAKEQYAAYAREMASEDATVAASAKQRYAELLKSGGSYLDMLRNRIKELEGKRLKLGLDVEGTQQLEKLRKLLTAENTTDGQVQAAIQALANLEKKAKEYAKSSGSAFYDELREQYRTYQQQLSDIQETYAEQRAEAEKQGNSQMIAEINAKEQAELSKLAASRLMASESWNQLFSDLSTLSAKTINKLMADINSQKVTLSAQFNPADLQAINTQLEKAKEELHKRNPFLALRDALAELRASMKANKLFEEDSDFGRTLREKKAQYQQYAQEMASADETVANSAGERYKTLLQEGATFTEYLKRRIEALKQQKVKIGVEFDGEQELANLEAILKKEQGEGKTTGEALKATFQSVGSSIEFLKGCFDSVVGGMKKMGVQMDAETETILNDIGGMMDGAAQFAQGYATMNPLQMIQGTVGFMSSVFDLFNTRDRRAEESIERHQEAVKRLGNTYNQLRHEVDKALGDTVYKNQNSMIQNLRKQQAEIRGMIEDEKSKKKTDWGRIEEWEEQIAEASRQIEDIIDEISKGITQTNAKDLSNALADALVEAFEDGEDAADSFGKVANDVLKNAVKNALKLQFLEKPLQKAISQLQKDMGFDEEGNGAFNGLSAAEQARFKDAIAQAGANFNQAMQMYKDLFEQLDESDPSTLSGAIKGASQESIDLLSGQANAVRVNQVTSLDIMRQQLTRLSNIDANVGVIAGRLLTIINKLTIPADDGLRGQGILE